MESEIIPDNYQAFLTEIKERIRVAQIKAALAVNNELVLLYWNIGRSILERQSKEGWGAKIIDKIAKDLSDGFPDIKGFSTRNLKYIRAFAEAWPDEQFVQQAAAQIPWFHNCTLLDKVKAAEERKWYIRQTVKNGWSRNILVLQIESALYHRQGQAITNFDQTLPPTQSDLAREIIKDPYNFDFLSLGKEVEEREVERGLLNHIRDFLLELGKGFAFLGSQYHLSVGDKDFYIDLLFYHVTLRCYVVIDLKMGEFEPEFAGKMGFYIAAVDRQLKHFEDKPSIGIVLCKSKNKVIAEYSLSNISKPIGISEFRTLPNELKESLPGIEELERELEINEPKKVL
jgi:predicted nuclease of restriction endonuclease-like (RecB) superfamily